MTTEQRLIQAVNTNDWELIFSELPFRFFHFPKNYQTAFDEDTTEELLKTFAEKYQSDKDITHKMNALFAYSVLQRKYNQNNQNSILEIMYDITQIWEDREEEFKKIWTEHLQQSWRAKICRIIANVLNFLMIPMEKTIKPILVFHRLLQIGKMKKVIAYLEDKYGF